MQCTVVPQQEDPLFFDREGLEAVASGTVVAEGLRAFKEHRVLAVDQDQGLLWAEVEDTAREALQQGHVGRVRQDDRVQSLQQELARRKDHQVAFLLLHGEGTDGQGHHGGIPGLQGPHEFAAQQRLGTDDGPSAYDRMRANHRTRTNASSRFNDSQRPHRHALLKLSARVHYRAGVNAAGGSVPEPIRPPLS